MLMNVNIKMSKHKVFLIPNGAKIKMDFKKVEFMNREKHGLSQTFATVSTTKLKYSYFDSTFLKLKANFFRGIICTSPGRKLLL